MSRPEKDNPNSEVATAQTGQATWRRLIGNFGFGFIFIGALLNLALFIVVMVLSIDLQYLYQPWWPTYLLFCCIAGWSWRLHGNRHLAEA
jgi:hypothetical protein